MSDETSVIDLSDMNLNEVPMGIFMSDEKGDSERLFISDETIETIIKAFPGKIEIVVERNEDNYPVLKVRRRS